MKPKFCFLAAVIAVAGFVFLAEAAPQDKLIRARVAIPAISLAQLPLEVGVQVGIFKAEGLDIGIEQIQTPADIASVVNGEVQLTSNGSAAIRAAAGGAPVKLLTGGSEKPAFYLIAQPEIKKVTDLRGKIIGLTGVRSLVDIATRSILKQHGMDADKDVRATYLGSTGNVFTALASKRVSAGLLSPPFDYKAKKLGLQVLLFAGDYVHLLQGGFASSDQQIAANPDMIRRFIRAYIRSLQFTQSQKEKTLPVIIKTFQMDEESAAEAYNSVKGVWRADGGVSNDVVQNEIEVWKSSTKQPRDVSLDKVMDFSFLRQVQQELNIKPLD
ncbi:MAG TPA: ABC transporter substrate-binding protein [bacterium]|nr:ABC transporter substrate-binding protein [bacterium]